MQRREMIVKVVGIDEKYDRHRLQHLDEAGYTREELERLNGWWARFTLFGDKKQPGENLRAFAEAFPTRGETGCIALLEACWKDGMKGSLMAWMLSRKAQP